MENSNITYHVGDSVQVLYNGKWFSGTVISEPKILLSMHYYDVQFIYKEDGKAPESMINTFGVSEIRFDNA